MNSSHKNAGRVVMQPRDTVQEESSYQSSLKLFLSIKTTTNPPTQHQHQNSKAWIFLFLKKYIHHNLYSLTKFYLENISIFDHWNENILLNHSIQIKIFISVSKISLYSVYLQLI